AASSAARLMRRPDDSFSRVLAIEVLVVLRFRRAFSADTFVLMIMDMVVASSAVWLPTSLSACVGSPLLRNHWLSTCIIGGPHGLLRVCPRTRGRLSPARRDRGCPPGRVGVIPHPTLRAGSLRCPR